MRWAEQPHVGPLTGGAGRCAGCPWPQADSWRGEKRVAGNACWPVRWGRLPDQTLGSTCLRITISVRCGWRGCCCRQHAHACLDCWLLGSGTCRIHGTCASMNRVPTTFSSAGVLIRGQALSHCVAEARREACLTDHQAAAWMQGLDAQKISLQNQYPPTGDKALEQTLVAGPGC